LPDHDCVWPGRADGGEAGRDDVPGHDCGAGPGRADGGEAERDERPCHERGGIWRPGGDDVARVP